MLMLVIMQNAYNGVEQTVPIGQNGIFRVDSNLVDILLVIQDL